MTEWRRGGEDVSIQRLIRNADPDKIDQYLTLARMEPCDPDKADMTDMIVEMGMSVYQAAKVQSQYTSSKRSFNTLHYHARMIVEDLYEFLGEPIQLLVTELARTGSVVCPKDRVSELRQACEDMGYDVVVETVFRRTGE